MILADRIASVATMFFKYQPDGSVGEVSLSNSIRFLNVADRPQSTASSIGEEKTRTSAPLASSYDNLCLLSCTGEDVTTWNFNTSESISRYWGNSSESQAVILACHEDSIAVGYDNGYISMYKCGSKDALWSIKVHKKRITAMCFSSDGNFLASGSLDRSLSLFDCNEQQGVFKVLAHNDRITQIQFIHQSYYIVSSSYDGFLKVWNRKNAACVANFVLLNEPIFDFKYLSSSSTFAVASKSKEISILTLVKNSETDMQITKTDKIIPKSNKRVMKLDSIYHDQILIVQNSDKNIEFHFFQPIEASENSSTKLSINALTYHQAPSGQDNFDLFCVNQYQNEYFLALSLSQNNIVTYRLKIGGKMKPESIILELLNNFGSYSHNNEVICTKISPDNQTFCTATATKLNIWNHEQLRCLRTYTLGNKNKKITQIFYISDDLIMTGHDNGLIIVHNIQTDEIHQTIEATGNHKIMFIGKTKVNNEIITVDFEGKVRKFTIDSKNKLESMSVNDYSEKITCACLSPDDKCLILGLLNNNMKVIRLDNMKCKLNLYGHKLPVNCLDVDSNSSLLVSGSNDKDIWVWGMNFGDCHFSRYAHKDGVLVVKFHPLNNAVFSAGKDNLIKIWHSKNGSCLYTITGHFGPIWCLDISRNAQILVSGSADRSCRVWYEAKGDPIIEELEREKHHMEDITKDIEKDLLNNNSTTENITNIEGEAIELPSYPTFSTLGLTENLVLAFEDIENQELVEKVGHGNPRELVLSKIRSIPPSELQSIVSILPQNIIIKLIKLICEEIDQSNASLPAYIDVYLRFLLQIIRAHSNTFLSISSSDSIVVSDSIQKSALSAAKSIYDCVDYNLSGLQFLLQKTQNFSSPKIKKKDFYSQIITQGRQTRRPISAVAQKKFKN